MVQEQMAPLPKKTGLCSCYCKIQVYSSNTWFDLNSSADDHSPIESGVFMLSELIDDRLNAQHQEFVP